MHTDKGHEQMIREYDAGEFLCGITLLGKVHRFFSLRALTDLTCLILNREKFGSIIQRFPELVPIIIATVAEKISAWEEKTLLSRVEGCEACARNIGISLI